MEHISTREHYEKYAALSKRVPTAYAPHYNDVELLTSLYQRDENLNNIPLAEFDAAFGIVRGIPKDRETIDKYLCGGLSLAENCCILKHILIYRVLGCKPILFETYDECRQARGETRPTL